MKTKTIKPVQLNVRELAMLRQLADEPATIEEIAKRFRRAKTPAQQNSWARNSLRRPLRLGLIKKVGRGTYNSTPKGRDLLTLKVAKAA